MWESEKELRKEVYMNAKSEAPDSAMIDYGIDLNPPLIPESEDCSDAVVPVEPAGDTGKRRVLVSELVSVTRVFFRRYKLALYSYLNRCLRNGTLAKYAESTIRNSKITHEICSFPRVTYWRIDRENFYADVEVELLLNTQSGEKRWKGYLICWCCFEERKITVSGRKTVSGLSATIEELTSHVERNGEYDLLDKHLAPCVTNRRVDQIAEGIWEEFCPEALEDPNIRTAKRLAEKMRLTIMHEPVYEHRGVKSILFFREDQLSLGVDRWEADAKGRKKRILEPGKSVTVPANTIVINTNRVRRDYSSFDIFHECYHYYEHYLFYCLQELASNDRRLVPAKEVVVEEDEVVKDSLYFMEKQADRGAYGLMMPVSEFRCMIREELSRVKDFRHAGDRYDAAGTAMRKRLLLPDFRIRARMIQLGHIEAKGSLNYMDDYKLEPFAFDRESWVESDITYNIREQVVKGLAERNDEFRLLMVCGKYLWVDGHVVRNLPRYVRKDTEQGAFLLTPYANAHVDRCCLRFVQKYVQEDLGRYAYGRLYLDADYLKQTAFYLDDIVNEKQVDELDAVDVFIEAFPKDFKSAVDQLKKKNKVSNAKLAEIWNMDDSTFARILDDPRRYRNEDFLTLLCLCFKTPDWISRLLFRRARFQLDDEDRRHRAIHHILRVQSGDGIEAANTYLKSHGLEPLRFAV